MVTASDAFPSKYLKATDLSDGPAVVTIKLAELERIKGFDGKEQPKVVVYFAKKYKPLILNRTNFDAITDIADSGETDDWVGTRIEDPGDVQWQNSGRRTRSQAERDG